MKNFGTEKYYWKVGIIQKIFAKIADFGFDFICWPGSITRDQNVSNHIVDNKYIINTRIFWHSRLSMKTSYSSKTFANIVRFSCVLLWDQNVIERKSHITGIMSLGTFLFLFFVLFLIIIHVVMNHHQNCNIYSQRYSCLIFYSRF